MADTAAPAAPAHEAPKPVRKLALRLDDGTLIRASDDSAAPQVLKPKDAWEQGLLNESHYLRLSAILCELHAKLPEEGPLKSISIGSKRSMDSVLEVNQAISAKRSHSVGAPVEQQAAPPTFAGDSGSGDWTSTCRQILDFLVSPKVLDADAAAVFRNPPNLAVVPIYPQHIKEPIWFDKISEKLNNGSYAGPEGFYKDILLLCDNCYKFNVELFPSDYGHLGVKLENTFLAAWGKCPFAATCPPRGFRSAPPRLKSRPPKKAERPVANGGARAAPASRGRRPGRPPGVARTKSVNSYGAQYAPPAATFTPQMQDALVAALHDAQILEANMQDIINILQAAGEMGVDEDGEPTLDLEKVTPPTAAKLYDLVVVKTGRAPAPAAGYAQMERDSDDDWDMDDE